MYLSELEIVGFKSFAQKITFHFPEGMTAMVGPNGCGKTNVVDAIRWVLGEQKTSVLRSDNMENIIFNGSKHRKKVSMAEVSLTIENNKQILPIEYNQVTITRRLLRSGESKYMLNKTKCRLRDIHDLFMDTGMGPDSYSVIELKMVEAILSGRLEERRSLFEEAAGITKYKQRRKESMRKLTRVQSDLERVQDILSEVKKNVNSLSRQAAKTRRYNKLIDEVRDLDLKLLKHDVLDLNVKKDSIQKEIDLLRSDKTTQQSMLSEYTAELDKLKENFTKQDAEFRKIVEEEEENIKKIANSQRDIAVSNEKISSLRSSQIRIEEQIKTAKNSQTDYRKKVEKNRYSLEGILKDIEKSDTALEKQRKRRNKVYDHVIELRESANEKNEEVIVTQNRITTIGISQIKDNERRESLLKRIESYELENKNIEAQKSELLIEYKNFRTKLKESEKRYLKHESELQQALETKNELQTQADELRNNINDRKNKIGGKTASLEFLNSLTNTSDVPKFLFDSKDWKPKDGKMILGEQIGADEEYRVAVDSALGTTANYFIVENAGEAEEAIKLLQSGKKGKASFIRKDSIPKINEPKSTKLPKGIIGYLSEIIRVEGELRSLMRIIFGNMLLTEDLDTAIDAVDNGIADSAVTLSGEIVNSSGLIKGGALLEGEGKTIGKSERIKKLKKDIKQLSDEQTKFEIELKDTNAKAEAIDIQSMNINLRTIDAELKANQQKLSQLDLKSESFDQKIILNEQGITRFNEEIAEMENESKDYDSELVVLEENLLMLKEEHSVMIVELNETENKLEEFENESRQAEIESVQLANEKNAVDLDTKRYTEQIDSLIEAVSGFNKESKVNDEEIENLGYHINEIESELDKHQKNSIELKIKNDFISQTKTGYRDQIEDIESNIRMSRDSFDKSQEHIHNKELSAHDFMSLINGIIDRALESYDVDILEYEVEIDAAFEINPSRIQLSELKDKLSKLGNVNFLALEEYEKENERYEFYNKQVTDLIEARDLLIETIEEINETAKKNFMETFQRIRTNFKDLFITLFGQEAIADISLAEGDPLESDIEITAKPPGKKPHSIEMLSGGEKTLTAIALLFAIYLVKPSPFCILDEVDAPLDDNNIGRFIDLIKRFSNETQFLIVTHNKKTMAASDSLYGITMQEEGVSKVVSVRFDENK